MAEEPEQERSDGPVPPRPSRTEGLRPHRHRRHRSRRYRRLRRLWPLLLALLLLVVMLIAAGVSANRRLAKPEDTSRSTFGITFINRAELPARLVDVHLWWPDDSVELTYRIENLESGGVDFKQIWAPPGFRFKIKVTMQDGATHGGEQTLSAGTIGGLRVIIHDKGLLTLE